jgi:hypothetical protein
MPIFFDNHAAFELPSASVVEFLRAAREGKRDDTHVLPLDFFCGSDGAVYCVVDAPSADAVRHSHQRRGLPCGAVRDLAQMDAEGGFGSTEERLLVVQMRRRLQLPGVYGLLVSAA